VVASSGSRACGRFLLDSTSVQFLPTDLSVTAAVRCGGERASHNLQSLVSCRLGLHAQCVAHSKDDKQSGFEPSQGRELHSRLWQARVFGVHGLRGFDATQRILVDSSMMARHGRCMVQRHRIYSGLQDKTELQMLCYIRQPQAKHTQSPGRFCALAASPVVAASTHAASAKSFSPRDNLGLRSQLPLGCCLPMHDAAEHDLALLEVNSSLVSTGRGEFRGCYGVSNVRKGRACLATQEAPNEGAANITKRCSFSARSKPCKSGCGFLRTGTQASACQMRRAVGGTPAESTLAVSMEITHRSRTVLFACGHFLQVQFLRELDPSCRAATDSVSLVRSGMPLAQFLGLHAPCDAIQEAEKIKSSTFADALFRPTAHRNEDWAAENVWRVLGFSTPGCASFRPFGNLATPVRRELSSHCAGSCASLGLVSARKPLLLPIGASSIQQPTDKKLTSKLSASSLEAHKKVWPNLAGAGLSSSHFVSHAFAFAACTSLCALSAWDPQTLIRCEKRDSILQSSPVRTCQNFVTSLPAASSNSSVLVCSKSQRSGQQVAAAECLLRCVTVEQDTACMVGAVHLG
ncbi:unnamed protein product, partial [Polarella glacialis]